ncbi:Ankyrin repeat protein [Giardia duodenalis]|uniref:Ankyrin repeat protein n=1 Tax=Giardia intestinalis TaxID=5741 RepID=V6T9W2_GIAIN|nr:Ankyrin repeat protein [Giardia intestinalis]
MSWCASRYAIEMGRVACLKLSVTHEKCLLGEDGFIQLMIAVAMRSAEPLVQYKDSIRRRTNDGRTALMIAVYSNNIPAIKHLIASEKGMQRPDGRTALMIAAEKDSAEACRLLAPHESGIRISSNIHLSNKQEIGKPVALMLAIVAKSVRCLKWLGEYEKKMTETKQQMTSLMIAAQVGHVEAVQVLRSAEAGEQDSLGWTALMHAAAWDHPNIVKYLVPYELDLVDENDQSALDLAVKYGQLSCIRILAPACAPQFGEAALQKLAAGSTAPAALRPEIQSEICRYLGLGRVK